MREDTAVAAARAHRRRHGAAILRRFADLLALRSVASEPEGLQRAAEWIRDALNDRGGRAALASLPGAPPVVVGRVNGRPGRPVIGVYAHYDGQPADPARWSSPPFSPTLRDGPGGRIAFVPPLDGLHRAPTRQNGRCAIVCGRCYDVKPRPSLGRPI